MRPAIVTGLVFAVFSYNSTAIALDAEPITVGSKSFTESVVLGELVSHLVRNADATAIHKRGMGGTQVLWNALKNGDIDIYPEYTGTIAQEILSGQHIESMEDIHQAIADHGLRMTRPLGFNNTYAIGMKKSHADVLGIRTISDLRSHPDLRFGFSNEFMDRGDGWPSLKATYSLPHKDVNGLEHDLAYRGIDGGSIDAIDLYMTDADIPYYDLRVLQDDLSHFPAYHAVLLYRDDLEHQSPEIVTVFKLLEGHVSTAEMRQMNVDVKIEQQSETRVAAEFLQRKLGLSVVYREETMADRIVRTTREHLILVSISLFAAILIALPLGIIAARRPVMGQAILGTVGIIQTIPALALLVFMIPLLGIGVPAAIAALFLYSLLPIVRNTYTGLHDISPPMRESAEALGLPAGVRLRKVELPLASRSILAGIKTSAVINVGFATLGAFIAAGGYGESILTGIRLDNMSLILQGAIPAAVLALLVQGFFELLERVAVPKGLRLAR